MPGRRARHRTSNAGSARAVMPIGVAHGAQASKVVAACRLNGGRAVAMAPARSAATTAWLARKARSARAATPLLEPN